jgi:hypothetical protein
MLAMMVQMGMHRIVIDSGRINASKRFHIDATSAAEEDQSSRFDTRTTIGASGSFGFGLWSASASISSTIGYVSTDDVRTRENLTASAYLNSSVELHFRTDQVPLDRIPHRLPLGRGFRPGTAFAIISGFRGVERRIVSAKCAARIGRASTERVLGRQQKRRIELLNLSVSPTSPATPSYRGLSRSFWVAT